MSQSIPAASRKADATRALIVETAERLFRTLGYQKTTVADIARDCRMSPANVYRFFPSKAAINEAVAERLLGGLSDLAWSIARRNAPAAERLTALFAAVQEQTIALFFHEKTMHDMVAAAMDEHWAVVENYVRAIETAIRHIIMDGQAEGAFAPLDAEVTAALVKASMTCFMHPQVVQQCAGEDLSAVAAGMAALMLRALARRSDD